VPWTSRNVRAMDFTGSPMKGMVFVDPAGLHGDGLRQWVDAAAGHARGLPPQARYDPPASANDVTREHTSGKMALTAV